MSSLRDASSTTLEEAKAAASNGHFHSPDELCTICYTSELADAPSVILKCGHAYHTDCVRELLQHKWNTLRISFSYLQCPSCKQDIDCLELAQEVAPHREFRV